MNKEFTISVRAIVYALALVAIVCNLVYIVKIVDENAELHRRNVVLENSLEEKSDSIKSLLENEDNRTYKDDFHVCRY